MSIGTQKMIINRVMGSDSAIALFDGARIGKTGTIDAVFASTVKTARLIEKSCNDSSTKFLVKLHHSQGEEKVTELVAKAFNIVKGRVL